MPASRLGFLVELMSDVSFIKQITYIVFTAVLPLPKLNCDLDLPF